MKPIRPSLRSNVVALSLLQISNYIVPLLMLPYLTRVLGLEEFGRLVFAQALMIYVLLLVDYGFSWSATHDVSKFRDNKKELSRVFVITWLAQWMLFFAAAIVLTFVVLYSEKLSKDGPLFAAAMLSVFGSLLFPIWFLQGLEKLKAVAVIQILIRILVLIPIFFLVTEPSHSIRVLLIQGSAAVFGGVLALYWIKVNKLIDWYSPSICEIVACLRKGANIFGSKIFISFYTNLIPLVLGWVSGPVVLALFNVADKLRGAGQSLIGPLSQALYPRMSHLVTTDKEAAFVLIKKSGFIVIFIAGAASSLLWVFADLLVNLIAGKDYAEASEILRLLAALPLVIGLSNLFGVQIMLAKGMTRPFNVILATAAGTSVLLVWPLTKFFSGLGAAATLLVIEIFVMVCMAVYLCNKGYFAKSLWRNS